MLVNLARWLNRDGLRDSLLHKHPPPPPWEKIYSCHEIQIIRCICVHICMYYVSVYPMIVSVRIMLSSDRVQEMLLQTMLLYYIDYYNVVDCIILINLNVKK